LAKSNGCEAEPHYTEVKVISIKEKKDDKSW
jgi:hypothetical protein